MKVIGIDPAPVKNPTIFDGEMFEEKISASALKEYLLKLKQDHQDLLVCWDAPLTSFSNAYIQKDNKKKFHNSDFYTRKIEYIIKYELDQNPPSGISTMPYGSCPHWTITQFCLGLPKLFDGYSLEALPFSLITDNNVPTSGHHVIEVHPALALWAWLKNDNPSLGWQYKKNKKDFVRIKEDIYTKLLNFNIFEDRLDTIFTKIMNDDHLDAFLAWALGVLWLQRNDEIVLVGNKESGSILLPQSDWSKALNDKIHEST
jgi:hypothetical protein